MSHTSVLKKLFLIAALLAAYASLPAMAQKGETDYDHSVNFSQFHTYSWGHVHSSDPFAEARMREEVDRVLQARGWQAGTRGRRCNTDGSRRALISRNPRRIDDETGHTYRPVRGDDTRTSRTQPRPNSAQQ